MADEPLLLGVREAVSILHPLGRDTVYRLVREGRIRSLRVHSRIVIPRSELEAFIARELESGSQPEGGDTANRHESVPAKRGAQSLND